MDYKNFRQYRLLLTIGAIVLCVVGVMLRSPYMWIAYGAALLVMVVEFLLSYRYNRCPHCGRVLPGERTPTRCPYCDGQL